MHDTVPMPEDGWGAGRALHSLVSIGADACGLVVFGAVDVRAVVEGPVSPPDGSPPALVEKMPVKARKGSVLRTLVLEEQRALLRPELLQVSERAKRGSRGRRRRRRERETERKGRILF